jgi:multimeric flavodoxin WrbA
MPDRFLLLLGSTRVDGNTERLARRAASALPPGTEIRWLRLSDVPLEPFTDVRHESGLGYLPPEGNGATLLETTLWASDLVVAAPTYWYALPAAAKLYFDHWTGWLRVPGLDFKARMAGRRLWLVTVNADGLDESGASDLLVATMERTAGYMGMRFAGALVGRGNRPGEVGTDAAALARAERFFLA